MMRNLFAALLLILVLAPCAAAYGVTFYNPAWNPQDGMIFEKVDPDTPFTFNVKNDDIAITKITFTINREAKNAGVTVYNLKATPDFLPEVPENDSYEFNELKYSGFVPHDTTRFVYEFKVKKGWLENMSVSRDTVALHSYDSVLELWETLQTKIINEDASYVFYTAEQDRGVHYLFIGKARSGETAEALVELEEEPAEEEVEAPAEGEVEDMGVPSEITPVDLTKKPAPAQPSVPAQPEQVMPGTAEEGDNYTFVVTLSIILIVIIILVVYIIFGKKKGRYSVDKELSSYIDESLKRGKSKEEIKTRLLEVGWHHERVDKALARHKQIKTKPEHKPKPEPEYEPKIGSSESMSLAEAKAIAEKQKKLVTKKKIRKKTAKSKKK